MPDEEKKEPEKIKCPCCGELTLVKPIKIKNVILDEYMASIITGVPFTHTWELYNGTVRVTVESLDTPTSNALAAAVRAIDTWCEKAEEAGAANEEAAKTLQLARPLRDILRLFCGIKDITILRDGKIQKQFVPSDIIRDAIKRVFEASLGDGTRFESVIRECHKRCADPNVLSNLDNTIIRTVIVTQADLYTLLLDNGFDQNFWAGIELA